MNSLDLSIIIVNYNGKNYIEDCLISIKQHCKGINYELIVVDNASTDNSLDIVRRVVPESKIIQNLDNLGFAKANNIGVKKSKGENILLLNNDTILLDNLNESIEIIKQNDIGSLGIKMLDENKKYRNSIGLFPSPIRLLKLSLLFKKSEGFAKGDFNKRIYEIDWIEGSFLMTKRALWDKVGGLTEKYFMYVEDVDYCKKIERLGKKRIYYPNIAYIHFGGFNSTREIHLINGYFVYIDAFYKNPYKIILKLCLGLNKIIKLLKNKI